MTKWIEVNKELPPCDGFYYVKPRMFMEGIDEEFLAFYDGFVFRLPDNWKSCFTIEKWSHCKQPEKRYGKVTQCPPN